MAIADCWLVTKIRYKKKYLIPKITFIMTLCEQREVFVINIIIIFLISRDGIQPFHSNCRLIKMNKIEWNSKLNLCENCKLVFYLASIKNNEDDYYLWDVVEIFIWFDLMFPQKLPSIREIRESRRTKVSENNNDISQKQSSFFGVRVSRWRLCNPNRLESSLK